MKRFIKLKKQKLILYNDWKIYALLEYINMKNAAILHVQTWTFDILVNTAKEFKTILEMK